MGVKSVAFRIGACFRAACKHPFVVVMLCLLGVVYRSFPNVFSLLVSAFPIILCTGVLLGALLSFSQKKAPPSRGGEEEKVHFKTEISNDVSVVDKETSRIEEDSSDDDDDTERSQQGFELLNKEHGDGFLLKKDHSLPIPKLSSEDFEIDKSVLVGSCDSTLANIGSPAKHKDDEEILDSGSDQSGSSSPVAEIVPMLDDELHPLLDEDAPPGPPVNGSDDVSSADSDEEKTELQVEDEEEDEEVDKEELTKSAIKWTEEDEKNMMEVRSSELERNQLLESVMARRRSRKWVSMIMVGGKEFMNLESSGPPFVTTRTRPRQNPFDSLPDSYEEGLPPIPGSAPSILIPRRNPFDIPYYSNEHDKTGDNNSGLDFFDFQPKETTTTTTTLFEGSEFLNVGPSIFGKRDESYFAAEGTSYSNTQSNGRGNSKLSSSLSDGEDLEDKNIIEEDIEEEEKVDVGDREEKKVIDDEHMFEEAVLISKIEHASEDVGHGSQSSSSSEEEEDEEELGIGLRNILVDEIVMKLKNLHGEFKSLASSEVSEKGGGGGGASVEERRRRSSSLSSSSSSSSSCSCDSENGILRQPGVESSMSAEEDGGERREPVYDSSPPTTHQNMRRNLSSSLLDVHESWFPHIQVKRTVSFGLPPIQVKRTVSFAEGVKMMGSRDTEMSIPDIKEMLGSSTISKTSVSNSFPDTSNTQGDMKHLQDHQLSGAV